MLIMISVCIKHSCNFVFFMKNVELLRTMIAKPSFKIGSKSFCLAYISPPIILQGFFQQNYRLFILKNFPIDLGHDQQKLANWVEHFIILAEGDGNSRKVEACFLCSRLQKRGCNEKKGFNHNARLLIYLFLRNATLVINGQAQQFEVDQIGCGLQYKHQSMFRSIFSLYRCMATFSSLRYSLRFAYSANYLGSCLFFLMTVSCFEGGGVIVIWQLRQELTFLLMMSLIQGLRGSSTSSSSVYFMGVVSILLEIVERRGVLLFGFIGNSYDFKIIRLYCNKIIMLIILARLSK